MRNPGHWQIAAVVAPAIGAGACSRGETPKELAALDQAYQAGVITKDEYQAKKAAWEDLAALQAAVEKAREGGVYSADEYQARKQRLTAKMGALAALEKARLAYQEDWQPLEHVRK